MFVYTVNHIPTGNPDSSALNERNWLGSIYNDRAASFHIVIDSIQAIECIPLDEVAYHSGDYYGNSTSIGIEICESGDYKQNEENSVDLIAKMLKERNWGIDKLMRHYDWNGKNCPRIIIPYWDDFKYRIYKKIIEIGGVSVKPVLKLGSKGDYVKELQQNLIRLGYNLGSYGADGDFGNATDKTVKVFQKDYNLIADGIVGEATWNKLDTLLASMGQPILADNDKYKNTLKMIRNSINEVLGG